MIEERRKQLRLLRSTAEQHIEAVIKALDRENACKVRDEMLNFRRRFRLFCQMPVEPYSTHLRETIKVMPQYSAYLWAEGDRFTSNEAKRCDRLLETFEAMMQLISIDPVA